MCTQSENYGDFRQCVIPVTITCTLQGARCNTGIPNTFYGENIFSVVYQTEVQDQIKVKALIKQSKTTVLQLGNLKILQ